MADVEVAAGIRKHGQGIVLGFLGVDNRAIEMIGFPVGLPLGLDLLCDVLVSHVLFSSTVWATLVACASGPGALYTALAYTSTLCPPIQHPQRQLGCRPCSGLRRVGSRAGPARLYLEE